MNDTNKTKLDTPKSDSHKKASSKTTATKKPFTWSTAFITLALLIALAGLAGAAYTWLQFEQFKQQSNASMTTALNKVNSQLQNKLESNDLAQHVNPILTPLQSQLNSIKQSNLKASQARDSLTESTQKLFALYGRDKNGWQLAEVEYLLRIAQHRLIIEHDFQGAEKTLKAADEKISEIADPGLLSVRVSISDERVLLQSRKRPDLVGIVLSLSRITKQIPLLDLSANNQDESLATSSTMPEITRDPNAPWQDQVIQFAKGLVKVEQLKKSISVPAVNLINSINTLEENLKLAKWAVLERDQKQYLQLIKHSRDIFKRYFDANNNYHAEINAELERLLTLEIRPQLPDISGSLILLKAIMTKKEHQIPNLKKTVKEKNIELPKVKTDPAKSIIKEPVINKKIVSEPTKESQKAEKSIKPPKAKTPIVKTEKEKGDSNE